VAAAVVGAVVAAAGNRHCVVPWRGTRVRHAHVGGEDACSPVLPHKYAFPRSNRRQLFSVYGKKTGYDHVP
jgi:hypothetical protein